MSRDLAAEMADVGLTIVSVAELEELRALKRRVDGCRPNLGVVLRPGVALNGHGWIYATDLLAWLRESECELCEKDGARHGWGCPNEA